MVRYECTGCGRRLTASAYRATCPECGGELVNTKERTSPP